MAAEEEGERRQQHIHHALESDRVKPALIRLTMAIVPGRGRSESEPKYRSL